MMQDQRLCNSGDDSFTSTTGATPELVFTGPGGDDAASSSESVCSEADCSACCPGHVIQLDEDQQVEKHPHSSTQTQQKGLPGQGARQGQKMFAPRSVKFAVDSEDGEVLNDAVVDQPRLPQPQQSGAPTSTMGKECGANSSDYNATRNSSVYLDSANRKRENTNNISNNNGTVYRQSSLKWKQRNGSATFELNLSQEEFMGIHRHGGREQEAA